MIKFLKRAWYFEKGEDGEEWSWFYSLSGLSGPVRMFYIVDDMDFQGVSDCEESEGEDDENGEQPYRPFQGSEEEDMEHLCETCGGEARGTMIAYDNENVSV